MSQSLPTYLPQLFDPSFRMGNEGPLFESLCVVTIGNFDGVHLGHQKLFKLANQYKKKFKLNIGVVTFDPLPKMYFNKKIKNFRLSNIKQKNLILESLGVDFICTKKFDKKFT